MTYKLPYDVLDDFEPIALLANTPQLIIARKDFPAKDVKDLIAWLKANPDKATAATVGAAGGAQVSAIYFQQTDRHQVPVRALSRRRARDAGPGLRPGRPHVRPGGERARPGAQRHRQGLCGDGQGALVARFPTCRRIDEAGAPGLLRRLLARAVGAQGHAQGDHRQAQRRGRAGARRSEREASALPIRARTSGPREQQTPEALAAHHKAEIEKVVADRAPTGLKAE